MTNVFTSAFSDFFCNYGGGGSTLGLVILMAFTGKSNRIKTLGRLSLPAAIFGINEPIIFGLPIVLNPIDGGAVYLRTSIKYNHGYDCDINWYSADYCRCAAAMDNTNLILRLAGYRKLCSLTVPACTASDGYGNLLPHS